MKTASALQVWRNKPAAAAVTSRQQGHSMIQLSGTPSAIDRIRR